VSEGCGESLGLVLFCFAVGISEKPQLYDSDFGSLLDRQNSRKLNKKITFFLKGNGKSFFFIFL
jgi:hypothetical protein